MAGSEGCLDVVGRKQEIGHPTGAWGCGYRLGKPKGKEAGTAGVGGSSPWWEERAGAGMIHLPQPLWLAPAPDLGGGAVGRVSPPLADFGTDSGRVAPEQE